MAIDEEILRILICPRTHHPLREASSEEIAGVNQRISAGTAVTFGGRTVSDPVKEGLVPQGEPVLYPILEGIPVLLVDEAIRLQDAATAAAESGS